MQNARYVDPKKGHRRMYVLGFSQLPGAKAHSGDLEEKPAGNEVTLQRVLWTEAEDPEEPLGTGHLENSLLCVFVGLICPPSGFPLRAWSICFFLSAVSLAPWPDNAPSDWVPLSHNGLSKSSLAICLSFSVVVVVVFCFVLFFLRPGIM